MRLRIYPLALVLLATAAFGFDFADPAREGLGGAIQLSDPSAAGLVTLPVAAIDDYDFTCDLGWQRQYELSAFDQVFAAGAVRRGRATFSLGLSQFGKSELYCEQTAKLGLGVLLTERLSVGATVSALRASFGGGYSSLSAFTCGLAARYRYDRLHVALAADNLTSPKLDDSDPGRKPTFTLFAEVVGKGAFSVLGRATLEDDQRPQLAIAQLVQISEVGGLFWGISTHPTEYGGGVRLRYRKGQITYAGSYHPSLGFTQTLSLAFSFNTLR